MGKIVLVSCVKKKRQRVKCKAKDLYISPLFKKSWEYANALGADKIYILSAKYYLLDPDTKIVAYNETLIGKPVAYRKKWAQQILSQLKARGHDLENDEFIFLAGKIYYEHLLPQIKNYITPFHDSCCHGIGDILRFLTKQLLNNKP